MGGREELVENIGSKLALAAQFGFPGRVCSPQKVLMLCSRNKHQKTKELNSKWCQRASWELWLGGLELPFISMGWTLWSDSISHDAPWPEAPMGHPLPKKSHCGIMGNGVQSKRPAPRGEWEHEASKLQLLSGSVVLF